VTKVLGLYRKRSGGTRFAEGERSSGVLRSDCPNRHHLDSLGKPVFVQKPGLRDRLGQVRNGHYSSVLGGCEWSLAKVTFRTNE
jgi:hypothetical protein